MALSPWGLSVQNAGWATETLGQFLSALVLELASCPPATATLSFPVRSAGSRGQVTLRIHSVVYDPGPDVRIRPWKWGSHRTAVQTQARVGLQPPLLPSLALSPHTYQAPTVCAVWMALLGKATSKMDAAPA